MSEQKMFRCAIYTRKSSEEGLDQDFNSLEAQREACQAYVRSQSHEGWKLIPDQFDDGGFSGGNMQRPALDRLMDKVRAGEVDIIVIYKIDRLTRSLADFARLAETFDKHGVSFVSITQQFNTTTSMGRLMLNVLLSFAQFEREITGERIRDKIAASKKKGMWMGGTIPMGYDVVDRRLTINGPDAQTVRTIFQLYLETGTVPALLDRLSAENIRTAKRYSAKGNHHGNRPFTRGHLYKLLTNPIYIGRVPHKDRSHPGQHEPIIDKVLWEAVQTQLGSNTQGPRARRRRAAAQQNFLAELLVSERGHRFVHSHASKGTRQYRYYVEQLAEPSSDDLAVHEKRAQPRVRLPAREIETAALQGLAGFFLDQNAVLNEIGEVRPHQIGPVLAEARRLAETLQHSADRNRADLFVRLVTQVTYRDDGMTLTLSRSNVREALGLDAPSPSTWPTNRDEAATPMTLTYRVPLTMRRRGEQMKITITDTAPAVEPDQPLITAIVRAWDWSQRLILGKAESLAAISREDGLSMTYVHQVMPLAFLAPDIVEAILCGEQPSGLTADRLIWDMEKPELWKEQMAIMTGRPSRVND